MPNKMLVGLLVLSAIAISSTLADHTEEHYDSLPITISPIVIPPSAVGGGACPSNEVREAARQNLTEEVRTLLREVVTPLLPSKEVPECGEGRWLPVVTLNMTDLSQQCPGEWMELSQPRRTCGRRLVNGPSCDSAYFSTNGFQYRKVCGRMLGDSYTTPDGFKRFNTVNYLDGVSVTYGEERDHIWSFAAGHAGRCPCDNDDRNYAPFPPAFVGDNYFCDTTEVNGNLWDGEDCADDCCTFNSPPWFKVQLPERTREQIEMRVCGDQGTSDENIPIEYIEMYVQ